MLKKLLLITLAACPLATLAQSIDQCQQMAEANWPEVRRLGLLQESEQLTLSNISKNWLPQIEAYAQATAQNRVTELPGALTNVLESQGTEVKGLSPFQYKMGGNITQTIYDGGATSTARQLASAQTTATNAGIRADIYAVKRRVIDLYFGWLLIDEQLRQNRALTMLLDTNISKMQSLHRNGLAMACDVDALRAEKLTALQTRAELVSTRDAIKQVLSMLCGQTIDSVQVTAPEISTMGTRPELELFDSQAGVADAQEKQIRGTLLPKVGLFAQGYYGYTGLDMYHDMFDRNPTLNGIVGAKVSWNISSLYTSKSQQRKVQLQKDDIEARRSTFLHNQNMQLAQARSQAQKFAELASHDSEIIALRTSVRKAAEAKLQGGTIDAAALLQEITREHQAIIAKAIHDVEYMKSQYEIKFIEGK